MTEEEWLACDTWDQLRLVQGESDRKLRLFAVALCRLLPSFGTDITSVETLATAEEFCDGRKGAGELTTRHNAADAELNQMIRDNNDPHGRFHAVNAALQASYSSGLRAARGAGTLADIGDGVPPQTRQLILLDIFGNPFRPVTVDPSWLTSTVTTLARQMYESRDFSPMPILADALQDVGCDHADILAHCRSDGPHVRGCWVVDQLLGKA
jgi:hypothetical protein